MPVVPDDLIQRFHDANESFRRVSARLDAVEEMSLAERQALASSLRMMESEIEELERQINHCLHIPDTPGSGPGAQA
jgi:hypothetical protein